MRSIVFWLAFPAAALLLTFWAESRLSSDDGAVGASLASVEDPKIERTLASFDPGLDPAGGAIPIHVTLGPSQSDALGSGSRKRMEAGIAFGDGPVRRAVIKARGQSSLILAERGSLSVRLEHGVRLGNLELDRLWLLNLSRDPYGFELATSYTLLRQIDLFPSFFELATVRVNRGPEAVYLLVERPEDAVRRLWPEVRSVVRLRRKGVEVKYASGSDPFRLVLRLQRLGAELPHEVEAESLSGLLNLEQYLKWLAVNSLLENGDSRNELFFFEVPTEDGASRLNLVPWDYDDLQEPPRRPGNVLPDPLFYASEMALDRRVHANPILRERFLVLLRDLLERSFTTDALTRTLAGVRERLNEIDPGRSRERARAMSRFEERLLARRETLLALAGEGG